ncbi:MAG: GyrI-like domain-containing protein [Candidatus Hydrogenedentes bacterium]|nr:GyrI-like domain-containing protein [Candidatus Hydrogenedentota bacterium]
MVTHTFEVEEKSVPAMLIAGVRMKGHYSDCGKGFALIGRRLGRHLCGKPFNLYYDACAREGDADLEACVPMKRQAEAEGISVRELPGERCVTLLHEGPYETLGVSYEKVRAYIDAKRYTAKVPSREVYHKGPGMIFRGNPKKYLTEIQIPIA